MVLEFVGLPARVDGLLAILSAPLAWRVYALIAGTVALGCCLAVAIWADRRADARISDAATEYKEIIRGQPAFNDDTVADQVKRIRAKAPELRRAAWGSLGISFFAGVVAPSLALLSVVCGYTWFDSGGGHLVDAMRQPVSQPSVLEAATFVADQTLRGGLFDLLEVFAVQVTHLDNNPANVWFSAGVFAHHLFVEAFIFSGILLFGRSLLRVRQLERQTLEWFSERTRQAKARQAEKAATRSASAVAPVQAEAAAH